MHPHDEPLEEVVGHSFALAPILVPWCGIELSAAKDKQADNWRGEKEIREEDRESDYHSIQKDQIRSFEHSIPSVPHETPDPNLRNVKS